VTAPVEVLGSGDEALAGELAGIINDAYAAGEQGLWVNDAVRTTAAEMTEAIRRGEMLAARLDGRVVGCARLKPLDERTADLGYISAATDHWGSGVGRRLVHSAEEVSRSRGLTTMQLELLVPRDWAHPDKERLRAWYTRLGYRVVRSAPIEEVAPWAPPQLATPCEFLIFRKML
jgi:GNAT superfamily N-acetyltransferase